MRRTARVQTNSGSGPYIQRLFTAGLSNADTVRRFFFQHRRNALPFMPQHPHTGPRQGGTVLIIAAV